MAGVVLTELMEMLMSKNEDVRVGAHLTLAQLSGTDEGAMLLGQCSSIMNIVMGSMATASPEDTSQMLPTVLTLLTNIAITPAGAKAVLSHHKILLPSIIKLITEPKSRHADRACGLLVNLTRLEDNCKKVLSSVMESDVQALHVLMMAASNTAFNTANNSLDLLMAVFENFSQLSEGRKSLLDPKKIMITRLLPFVQYAKSKSRRRAVVATLHNCCFEKEYHEWLLSPSVDIASYLCLPLAGPDTFTEKESADLPDLLVYQPEDKIKEPDADIRLLLLQALTQLCVARGSRERLRELNIYLILRELHKWEQDQQCLVVLEDLVNILIRTEEEIGAEDISSLEVPEDLRKKFEGMDKQNEENPVPAPSE
ncbi:Protein HGH1 C-terminal [Trinorchestia longiramus]|nr:Protein HGH1 C-terminal [Trinorchestia longiramus]